MPARGLAKLLKPFGISPATLRINPTSRVKGYDREMFKDAFIRYLPDTSNLSVTACQINNDKDRSDFIMRDAIEVSRQENTPKMASDKECHGVTDKNELSGGGSIDLNNQISTKEEINAI